MKNENYFVVPLGGLKEGETFFKYELDQRICGDVIGLEISDSDLVADLQVFKRGLSLTLDFKLKGTIKTLCDRCNDVLDLEIEGDYQTFIKLGDDSSDLGIPDEDMTVGLTDSKADVSKCLKELVTLSVPFRKVHENDSCDPIILGKLLGENSNVKNEENFMDPRWSELKKLKK